jgi:hypothetical protein
MLIRLTPEGTRDMTFGFGIADRGVLRSNPLLDDGGAAEVYNVTVQSNGNIVTTGYGAATAANTPSSFGYATTTAPDLVSFAFTGDGKMPVDEWGNGSKLVIQSEELALTSSEDRGRDMLALGDDRLVYAGKLGPNPAIFVATPDGQHDPANDVGQLFTYDPLLPPPGATSHFFRIVLSPDGTRLAAATNQHAEGVLLAVLKVGEE